MTSPSSTVRERRLAASLTQLALAAAAKVSLPTLARIEKHGTSCCRVSTLQRIAAVLGVRVSELV